MSSRRDRAARAARAAQQVEDGAKLAAFQSQLRVEQASDAIDDELEATQRLVGAPLSPALRALLLSSGARHLELLHEQKDQMQVTADLDRTRWDGSRIRVRSLDKLVERLGVAQTVSRRLADHAEWQDIVTSRPAGTRGPNHQPVPGVGR